MYSRGHGDEQHVRGSEEDVRAVTQPDVPQRVHDEHTNSHQQGEDTQSQLAPQSPAHRQVAHQQRRQSPCGPAELLEIHLYVKPAGQSEASRSMTCSQKLREKLASRP